MARFENSSSETPIVPQWDIYPHVNSPPDDDDSEKEDKPRRVLETGGDFVSCSVPDGARTLNARFPRGVPEIDVNAMRPVPNPEAVRRAREAMLHQQGYRWYGSVFSGDLEGNFAERCINTPSGKRTPKRFMLRRRAVDHENKPYELKTMLLFADGACYKNRGSWQFRFCGGEGGTVTGALEASGPTGERHAATPTRASLRAVIAALDYREWYGEG